MTRPYELIVRKRDGLALSPEEIREFMRAYTQDQIPDYQMSALLMAIFFRGMSPEELSAWADAMLRSGDVLDLSDLPGVKVDKHSTGGVGDKISLPLAPLAAALGVVVPMVSGRGLGHTGGTLDKLESIPGFRTDLSVARFREILRSHGACLIGQTAEIAPADKRLYALRDVTGTVESIPLIASSIMSKKLAEGIDALVLDVKVGKGAFMKEREQARVLASTMIEIGARMGRRVVALLTPMDQPLGRMVGNALEVAESIEVLQGKGPADLVALTVELTAEMVLLAGRASSMDDARQQCQNALRDGSALSRFRAIVEAHGGDPKAIDDISRLPQAPEVTALRAPRSGYVVGLDALTVGLAAVDMGAGRARKEDSIDPGVGIVFEKRCGDEVKAGDILAHLHHRGDVSRAAARILGAYEFGDAPIAAAPVVYERLG
jgi:pyrimidine-nucleoside phosphorylase